MIVARNSVWFTRVTLKCDNIVGTVTFYALGLH